MKHLIIARHGNYNSQDLLSEYGAKQMETLSTEIKHLLNGSSVYIISSTAPRALGSSQVLSTHLTSPGKFEQIPYLWSGTDAPDDSYYSARDKNKLMEIINEHRDKADALIIVTHLEVTEDLPEHFFRTEFDKIQRIHEIEKGEAIHIDLERQIYNVLNPQ